MYSQSYCTALVKTPPLQKGFVFLTSKIIKLTQKSRLIRARGRTDQKVYALTIYGRARRMRGNYNQ